MSFRFDHDISVTLEQSTPHQVTTLYAPSAVVAAKKRVEKVCIVLCNKTVDTLKEEVKPRAKRAKLTEDVVLVVPLTRERYNLDPCLFINAKEVTLTMHVQSHYDANIDEAFRVLLNGVILGEFRWDSMDAIAKCDIILPLESLANFSELFLEGIGTLKSATLLIE